MNSQPKWIYLAVALAFFFGSAGVTVWLLNGSGEGTPELPLQNSQAQNAPDAQQQGPGSVGDEMDSEPVQLEAGATLVRIFDGIDGQVHSLPLQAIPDQLTGKTKMGVEAERPDWTVLELNPERLMVKVDLSEAASASGTRYIGVYDGRIALFSGEPGVSGQLQEVTDIQVKWLPEYEQANLRQGQEFAEDELEMILEGLSETAQARQQGD